MAGHTCASPPERNHTTNTRWHDLIIDRLPDGGIHLEQSAGVEEPNVIHLHTEQVIFIARQLCGMKPETAAKVADLERRIAVLTDRLQSIVCNGAFRTELIEGLCEGFEYISKLDGLLDLALEFDGGRLTPECRGGEQQEGHGASKRVYPCTAIDQAKKAQPRAIPEGGEQLGLPV